MAPHISGAKKGADFRQPLICSLGFRLSLTAHHTTGLIMVQGLGFRV